MSIENIRNFCIIAHIDAGKSTRADRFLELTGAIEKGKLRTQCLDQMDLERERGITIKLQPVRMRFGNYILNLVDTPGHMDFFYEVSRTLAVVEGAILLIDGTQGVQVQTLSTLEMALEQNLVIIPAINKIDLSNVQIQRCQEEIKKLLGEKAKKIYQISAKTGEGIEELIQAVIHKIPEPQKSPTSSPTPGVGEDGLKALVFDSHYDQHRGVVVYIRVFNGKVRTGDRIKFLAAKKEDKALEIGVFTPVMRKKNILSAGEIGYVITGLKTVSQAQVGDTLILAKDKNVTSLPGYQRPQPMVFASVFPISQTDYPLLSQALNKLSLNDSSFESKPDHSPILGTGFELGILGLLHLDILLERLRREYKLDVIATTPSPRLKIIKKNPPAGESRTEIIHGIWQMPDQSEIEEIQEPYYSVRIITPQVYLGRIMELARNFRSKLIDIRYLDKDRLQLTLKMPAMEILRGFYDRLKSVSSGFASLSYQFDEFRISDLVKLDVRIANELILPLSILAPRDRAYSRARNLAQKLKDLIPRAAFEIRIQIMQGGKIIASEKIPALKKNVTAGLYGGDVTRKRKLLEKQKKGKKRMKQFGRVEIPGDVFVKMLSS
jgi:GTP-binding protein LepA